MTPKEKAKRLFDKYYKMQESINLSNEQLNKDMFILYQHRGDEIEPYWVELAKKSAICLCDCMIREYKIFNIDDDYWKIVKIEIKKL